MDQNHFFYLNFRAKKSALQFYYFIYTWWGLNPRPLGYKWYGFKSQFSLWIFAPKTKSRKVLRQKIYKCVFMLVFGAKIQNYIFWPQFWFEPSIFLDIRTSRGSEFESQLGLLNVEKLQFWRQNFLLLVFGAKIQSQN